MGVKQKPGFMGLIRVQLTPSKDARLPVWETITPIWFVDQTGAVHYFPAGSKTNGGNVPWLMTWVIPNVEFKTFRPYMLHDTWLKNRAGRTRATIDRTLRFALKTEGVKPVKRWVIYLAVRLWSLLTGDK